MLKLCSVATYRFQHLTAERGWQFVGEWEAGAETSAREAFGQLVTSQDLPPGEYRYKRSDESDSHEWGLFTLDDGRVITY